jgi:hypothetical protein
MMVNMSNTKPASQLPGRLAARQSRRSRRPVDGEWLALWTDDEPIPFFPTAAAEASLDNIDAAPLPLVAVPDVSIDHSTDHSTDFRPEVTDVSTPTIDTTPIRSTAARPGCPPTIAMAPVPLAARDLLVSAIHGLSAASLADDACDRYAGAHLAALRGAAAMLAARARPGRRGRSGIRSAWVLLPEVAPELTEWATFFAAGASRRAAAEARVASAVSVRDADDLVRDVGTFLSLITGLLGIPIEQPPGVAHVG